MLIGMFAFVRCWRKTAHHLYRRKPMIQLALNNIGTFDIDTLNGRKYLSDNAISSKEAFVSIWTGNLLL
jgi:hypothetical protein